MRNYVRGLGIVLLSFLSYASLGQASVDTLSKTSTKTFKEYNGKIVEKDIFDYKVKITKIVDTDFLIPIEILHSVSAKKRAFDIMCNSKEGDTVFVCKQKVDLPFYIFWKTRHTIGNQYCWKNGTWNIEKDKDVSYSVIFEKNFWIKFATYVVVMMILGWVLFYLNKQGGDPIIFLIIGVPAAGFFLSYLIGFLVGNIFSFGEIFTLAWLKIGIINSIAGYAGGGVLYSIFRKKKYQKRYI